MTARVFHDRSARRRLGCALALAIWAVAAPAPADQEASNVAHVAAAPYGRCYAKSVPAHVYDPEHGPRQQGETRVYRVETGADALIQTYDWFSQRLFLSCQGAGPVTVIRLGPWHRGHDPSPDHLAIAFYRDGELIRSYSTLDISGGAPATDNGISKYANVSASVSHYTVFEEGPEMVRVIASDGPVFFDTWFVQATTVDGRVLRFDLATGELR